MHCCKSITEDLIWVGANDRRLAMFEGVYSVPNGVSYNSYLLLDEKTVLFDTVDKAVSKVFFENLEYSLAGRKLDYLVVHHMEPDHSATLEALVIRHPEVKIICNSKIATMIGQFFDFDISSRADIVAEGDTRNFGRHELTFIMAPMVHWPEVMVSYDKTTGALFSADAFGSFGALNGAIFADTVDFERDYLSEARRYYTNIVGKYGNQVSALLKKASALDIKMILPLHGFVWRHHLSDFITKYAAWSSYIPEKQGVMVVYASVYGNTENAAEIIAGKISDRGIPVTMFDVSVKPASDIVSASFEYSHIIFASTTYNAGIFVSMDEVISDLVSHNLQNRTVAVVENGSWAPTAGKLIREKLATCKNLTILDEGVSVKSSLKQENMPAVDSLVNAICDSFPPEAFGNYNGAVSSAPIVETSIDNSSFFKISYGLFILSATKDGFDNACIINTLAQVTDSPKRISVTVNKSNYTNKMIAETGMFNVSVLTENVTFDTFKKYGFSSGKDGSKFTAEDPIYRTANGVRYVKEFANAVISAKVIESHDYGTHTVFIADVTEAFTLSSEKSVTYDYYFEHIKPKPQPYEEKKKGWVCKICGYVYEGDELPDDYICPLCKHGAEDFERIE